MWIRGSDRASEADPSWLSNEGEACTVGGPGAEACTVGETGAAAAEKANMFTGLTEEATKHASGEAQAEGVLQHAGYATHASGEARAERVLQGAGAPKPFRLSLIHV